MGERHDLPKIKPEKEPSIFNHEAGKWGYLSSLAASLAAIPYFLKEAVKDVVKKPDHELTAKTNPEDFKSIFKKINAEAEHDVLHNPKLRNVALVTTGVGIVGALIGGSKEKSKQEHEQTEGRVVKTPGYWNKGIVSGMFVSGLINTIFNYGLKKPLGATTGLIVGIGSMVVGSVMRNSELKRDYEQALMTKGAYEQQKQQQTEILVQQLAELQKQQPTYKDSVTPDEMQALETRLQALEKPHAPAPKAPVHGEPRTHAEKVEGKPHHHDAEKAEPKPHHDYAEKTEHKPHATHAERVAASDGQEMQLA